MVKTGVLGVGHLGKIHLNCVGLADNLELMGFFDPDDASAKAAIEKYGVKRFDTLDEMLQLVDAVDIVTPTVTHYKLAKQAIERGKHIFIEKPITYSLTEAEELLGLVKKHKVKAQVGHVERFNPALLSLQEMSLNPLFIEGHRLAMFNPRGTDVSVVLDLMIHDIDILLSVVKSPVTSVSAAGVSIVSPSPDIANVRLEFESGCVANLTASRISLKQMRKLRLFQQDAYISIDFLEKDSQIVRLYDESDPNRPQEGMELDTATGKKIIHVEMPESEPVNAIQMELEEFGNSILNDTDTKVPLSDGYEALRVAQMIIDSIKEREEILKKRVER